MRNVMMFVAGFVVMTVAGVAVAQTGILSGDEAGPEGGDRFVPLARFGGEPGEAHDTGLGDPPWQASTGPVEAPHPDDDHVVESAEPQHTEVELVVVRPKSGAHVESATVVFEGTTTPGAKVWSGDHIADVDDRGAWRLELPIEKGTNVLYVGAHLDGTTVTEEVTIHRGEALEWSITQKVRSSATPFEKFIGTGSPGMRISVASEHGSNHTTIPDGGEWSLGVEFDSEPGTSFPVTVTTSTGWARTYTFSHVGEKPTREWSITHSHAENRESWTKFTGTGPTGTTIVGTSEFGSSDTTIGEHGEWALKIWFDAPVGVVFPVRVTNSLGFDRTYEFVRLGQEFTVHQAFGDHDQPWEKFTGTGMPGTSITVSSEHGGGQTTIGAGGEWQLVVEFHDAPIGVWFPIHLSTDTGVRKSFEFIHVASPVEYWTEQVYGSCAENPPYDVFHGRTAPHSIVEIGSPYGGARIEVGPSGEWEKKVIFEYAPIGETFEVVVADSDGNTSVFTFTRLDHEA